MLSREHNFHRPYPIHKTRTLCDPTNRDYVFRSTDTGNRYDWRLLLSMNCTCRVDWSGLNEYEMQRCSLWTNKITDKLTKWTGIPLYHWHCLWGEILACGINVQCLRVPCSVECRDILNSIIRDPTLLTVTIYIGCCEYLYRCLKSTTNLAYCYSCTLRSWCWCRYVPDNFGHCHGCWCHETVSSNHGSSFIRQVSPRLRWGTVQ